MARFTPDRRHRFLALLEAGRTVGEACALVDVSRTTIGKWVAKGRVADAPDEARAFAERYATLRDERPTDGLSREDLIRMLERQARKGSVQAMKMLLERPWEKNDNKTAKRPHDPFDVLDQADDEVSKKRAQRRRPTT